MSSSRRSTTPPEPARKRLVRLLLLAGALLAGAGASPRDPGEPDPRWLDRMPSQDRACLERLIGYAPPAFPDEAIWVETEPMSWGELRGKVVVIQSWTSHSASGRNWALRARQTLSGFAATDVQLIALHTPEGAESADVFLQRRPLGVPAVIDATGFLCDALGVYRRPANIVVDRNGTVRYAGLNQRGLRAAIATLIEEPANTEAAPEVRPPDEPAPAFPPFSGAVVGATDVRGRRAPPFAVGEWLNDRPRAEGKVMVIDFWATWCPHCRNAIPHMNELADQFRDDVVCIGLSDESSTNFATGMRKYGLDIDRFRYYLALDPRGRMSRALRVYGLPNAIVMSSDWIVRWQGSPANLTQETLARIVEANKALGAGSERPPQCDRWAGKERG